MVFSSCARCGHLIDDHEKKSPELCKVCDCQGLTFIPQWNEKSEEPPEPFTAQDLEEHPLP